MGGDERQQHATTELKSLLTEHQLLETSQLHLQKPLPVLPMDILLTESDNAAAEYLGVRF